MEGVKIMSKASIKPARKHDLGDASIFFDGTIVTSTITWKDDLYRVSIGIYDKKDEFGYLLIKKLEDGYQIIDGSKGSFLHHIASDAFLKFVKGEMRKKSSIYLPEISNHGIYYLKSYDSFLKLIIGVPTVPPELAEPVDMGKPVLNRPFPKVAKVDFPIPKTKEDASFIEENITSDGKVNYSAFVRRIELEEYLESKTDEEIKEIFEILKNKGY